MEKKHWFKRFLNYSDYNPIVYFVIVIIIIGIPYKIYTNNKWDKMMAGPTTESFATYSYFSPAKNGSYSNFIFYVNHKKYSLSESGKYYFLSVGDSVKIRYSNKDPNYAEVINFLYMDKFKSLRNTVNWNRAEY
jgi:hypothetical protein